MEWNSGSILACQIWRADQYILTICFVFNHLCIFWTLIIQTEHDFLASLSYPSPLQLGILRVCVLCAKVPKKLVTLTLNSWFSFNRHRLRSAGSSTVQILSTCRSTARLLWRQPKPGTLCLMMSGTRLHCSPSVANLKLAVQGSRTLISCHVTDYINIVRWSCSSNATLPPKSC